MKENSGSQLRLIPFTIAGLQDVNSGIYHLGSLLADDFSLDVIKTSCRERAIVS